MAQALTEVPATDEPETITLDVGDLTFGDMCDIEEAVGVEAAATLSTGAPSLRAVTACIWIVKRRGNPTLTFDEVKQLKVTAVALK